MSNDYIEWHDGGYWVAGTRVSLDSVALAFLDGLSPESIVDSFPTLTLAQVYGAIAAYLERRPEIDALLQQVKAEFDALCRKSRDEHPLLFRKLDEARRQVLKQP